ncbi:hypothetical protein FO519_006709 [Halicephalobus sp. NKZ332]|nr:hypothetical protein FO519_006709 [Halicephalobus sp. NKZ332]
MKDLMSTVMTTNSASSVDLANELDQLLSGFTLTGDRKEAINKLKELIETKSNTEPKFLVGDDSDSIRSNPVVPVTEDIGNQTSTETELSISEQEDIQLLELMKNGRIKHRELEKKVSPMRAVKLRRNFLEHETGVDLASLPCENYDYRLVNGACCENPFGYMTIPVGCAGPLLFNKETLYLPLATTEGALIASINRGCKVLTESGGVRTAILKDGMTRAPVIAFEDMDEALRLYSWIQEEDNFSLLKKKFDSTSNYGLLQNIEPDIEGNYVYLRFQATTGDAMGMNMVSNGVQAAMNVIKKEFPAGRILALSGNQCIDKKAAGINWIKGRGKSVKAWAVIPGSIVETQLKTKVDLMVELCEAKNLIGSSTALSIGGWNCQAANIVAAIFLATGQDAAQVVSSSMCLTSMKKTSSGDLMVTCDMKCLEVGTVGGGTILAPQQTCLKMLKCREMEIKPGENARRLAEIICAAVVAGEVSLAAALLTDDLVKSHMTMNRSKLDLKSEPSILKSQEKQGISSLFSTPTTRVQNKNAELKANTGSMNKMEKIMRKTKHSDCFHLV